MLAPRGFLMREKPRMDADKVSYLGQLLDPDEVTATILLVAILSGLHAEGLFFTEANGVDAIGRDA